MDVVLIEMALRSDGEVFLPKLSNEFLFVNARSMKNPRIRLASHYTSGILKIVIRVTDSLGYSGHIFYRCSALG